MELISTETCFLPEGLMTEAGLNLQILSTIPLTSRERVSKVGQAKC